MATNVSAKELVQLVSIKEDDPHVEQKRLRNGDVLIRNAMGESLLLSNGAQIMLRPGYFSLNAAQEVTIERGKNGHTTLIFSNGDELKFNDEGIQSLKRELLFFQFSRKDREPAHLDLGNAFKQAGAA